MQAYEAIIIDLIKTRLRKNLFTKWPQNKMALPGCGENSTTEGRERRGHSNMGFGGFN